MLFQNVMHSHQAMDHLQHHISMYKKVIPLFHKNQVFNNRKNSRLGFKQKLEETNDQVNTEKKRVLLGYYFVRVCNLPFRHSYVFLNDF